MKKPISPTLIRSLHLLSLFAASPALALPCPPLNSIEPAIYGSYSSLETDDRPGAEIVRLASGKSVVRFEEEGVEALLQVRKGKMVFVAEELSQVSCDDPGCNNLLEIRGELARKRVNGVCRIVLKTKTTREFPYPESEGDPEGEVTELRNYYKVD